jgi:hypothetical protein
MPSGTTETPTGEPAAEREPPPRRRATPAAATGERQPLGRRLAARPRTPARRASAVEAVISATMLAQLATVLLARMPS